MYRAVLYKNRTKKLSKSSEKYVRHMIRKDVKAMIKMERESEAKAYSSDDSDDIDEDAKIEDKVIYGTDSDSDIDHMVDNRDTDEEQSVITLDD